MSNVILIEDNTTRQQEEYIGEPLSSFSDVLYNAIDNKYNKLFDTFKEEIIDLPYDVVIVHESAFLGYKTSIVEQLKDYCKINKKTLVFFSGGSTTISYNKKAGILYLPSKILYANIMTFLNDISNKSYNILLLAYGENWELNALNIVYNNIKLFLKENPSQDTRSRTFEKKVQLDLIDNIPEIKRYTQKKFLNTTEIAALSDIIKNMANKKIGL